MPHLSQATISITGLGALSGLANNLADHLKHLDLGRSPFRPLRELDPQSLLPDLPASWIEPRQHLIHRQWSPASCAALIVAREALASSRWTDREKATAAIFLGSSRGTLAGSIDPWPQRRALPLMAASNTLHSEPAAAISRELGIHGPWQVQASGCAAGLDALGMASLWLQAGLSPRALVVSVDLPLTPSLLNAYSTTGILSRNAVNDPYSPSSSGLLPGEAAAALTLEVSQQARPSCPRLLGYLTNSDGGHTLSSDPESTGTRRLLSQAASLWSLPSFVIPHGSGTASHAASEPSALRHVLPATTPICLLKPSIGHGIAGGGLLETVLLASFLQRGYAPARPLPLTLAPFQQPPSCPLPTSSTAWKIASSLGGKNSLIALQSMP